MTLEHTCGARVWVDYVRVTVGRIARYFNNGKLTTTCPGCGADLRMAHHMGELNHTNCEEKGE